MLLGYTFFNVLETFRNCAMLLKLTLFLKKNASFDRLAFYIDIENYYFAAGVAGAGVC